MNTQIEDTEWTDALRKHGILPPKPVEEEEDDFFIPEEPKRDLSNESDFSDIESFEKEFEEYSCARKLQALNSLTESRPTLKNIRKQDYVAEVTDVSMNRYVFVLLYGEDDDSSRVEGALVEASEEHGNKASFVKIKATECVPNYPKANIPTLIVYHQGNTKINYVGFHQLGGQKYFNYIQKEVKRILGD